MRLNLLLRPSWLGLTALVFTFAIAAFLLLSPWQFGRNDERQTQNEALQRSLTTEPRPLAEAFPDGAAPDERSQWTLVTITGSYLPDHDVVARLRSIDGNAAFEVLTPMRTTSGATVLVNRGYVRPDQHMDVPDYPAPPAGQVTITARARIDESATDAKKPFSDGALQTYRINSAMLATATGLDLRPGYFQLVDNQPGGLSTLPLPRTESGPFLSYALQWIAFGIMALGGWLYFTLRELKPGGVLHERGGRKSVAQQLAEDELADSHPSR